MITEISTAGAGVRTRVLQAGPADQLEQAEAVVFLHGVPGSADVWLPLLTEAGSFTRAVAIDLPGFGRTVTPEDWGHSPADHAEFLADVLDGLGIERVHLVMHDLGGVGLVWGAAYPERFASAVVMDTGVLVGYRWHAVARLFRTPVLGAVAARAGRVGMRQVMQVYNRGPRPLPDGTIRDWVAGYDRAARRALWRFYRATPAGAYEPLVPVLRRLDRPALVVWGKHDRFVPSVQAERQRLSFPSADVVVLPESGHYPHFDAPAEVAAAVLPFLRACAGGAD